jgi:hypothetical protein
MPRPFESCLDMLLSTPVEINKTANWNCGTQFVSMGSCFSDHISKRMVRLGLNVADNPAGIVFHPMPMAEMLQRAIKQRFFTIDDLFDSKMGWLSFLHHGSFRSHDADILLAQINERLAAFATALKSADVAIFTFGTAWGYAHQKSNGVVANCHKQPSSEFHKELAAFSAMHEQWHTVLHLLKELRPEIQIVFSVSPVRHTREGLVENQRSKARLIELVHALTQQIDGVRYFPAYEIMMDELRDYRFYERDMIHPSTLAVEIIWQRFVEAFFSEQSQATMAEVEQWRKLEEHRGLHESPEEENRRKTRAREAIANILHRASAHQQG